MSATRLPVVLGAAAALAVAIGITAQWATHQRSQQEALAFCRKFKYDGALYVDGRQACWLKMPDGMQISVPIGKAADVDLVVLDARRDRQQI